MRRLGALAVALVIVLGGCHGSHRTVRLDGSPRPPDDQGVVTSVSFTRVTLDGRRSYRIDRNLRCFSTSTLAPIPVLGRKGQYVQLGLRGKTVDWMAGFAAVVRAAGAPATVYYVGVLKTVRGTTATFRDGTVLEVESRAGVADGVRVRAEIDPDRHRVRRLVVL